CSSAATTPLVVKGPSPARSCIARIGCRLIAREGARSGREARRGRSNSEERAILDEDGDGCQWQKEVGKAVGGGWSRKHRHSRHFTQATSNPQAACDGQDRGKRVTDWPATPHSALSLSVALHGSLAVAEEQAQVDQLLLDVLCRHRFGGRFVQGARHLR